MTTPGEDPQPIEHGEVVFPGGRSGPLGEDARAPEGAGPAGEQADGEEGGTEVSEPAKVMRVGTMIKQLLEEVRATQLDEAGREGLRAIYDRSVTELSSALSPDLQEELARLAFPFSDASAPTEVELRMAQAQLVGWLEGLFHGIQATLFAQQMAARQQLENMRQQLPPGEKPPDRPGTYL